MIKVIKRYSSIKGLNHDIVLILLLISTTLLAQKPMHIDWQQYPRAYVENMASEASKEQILVQNSIKDLKADIKSLKSQRSKTKDTALRSDLKKSIDEKAYALYTRQNDLKLKIIQSKKYRDMLSLNEEELRARLAAEFTNHAPTNSMDSTKLYGQPVAPQEAETEHKPPKSELPLDESKPKETVSKKEEIKVKGEQFDDWIPVVPVNQPCKYQTVAIEGNKAIQPELLFTYTPEEIRKHLRGTPYSKGIAFIGREPGYTYLQIDIEIASDLALQYYGNLSKSFIIVRLINGKEVRLINSRFDAGKIDPKKRTTTMSGMYYIDKTTEKVLATAEMDSMRLNFTSGYEDYIIYNVDFFTRQLACINAVK